MDNPPTTLAGYFEAARRADTAHRKMLRVIGHLRVAPKETPTERYLERQGQNESHEYARRQTEAMEIDAMTPAKRNELMKRGACFFCQETGHMARDCPRRNKGKNWSPPKNRPFMPRPSGSGYQGNNYQPRPSTGNYQNYQKKKPTAAQIRAMIEELDDEEHGKLVEQAEEVAPKDF